MPNLTQLKEGQRSVYSDCLSLATLSMLFQMGVFPGDELILKKVSPFASSYWVNVKNKIDLCISKEEASQIIIESLHAV